MSACEGGGAGELPMVALIVAVMLLPLGYLPSLTVTLVVLRRWNSWKRIPSKTEM